MFEKWAESLRKKSNEVDVKFADFEEKANEEQRTESAPVVAEKNAASISATGNNIELKVVHPESFSEVSDIADHLIAGCTVVLNLEKLDPKATLRMLDFLNGVTYTTDGEIKKIAQSTYIITPNNVDVSDEDK